MTRLYFGKIAPVEAQGEQVQGQGWSWRYKVRIIDKHPSDKTLLPDEELPWAQVLLPVTAGSGAANFAQFPMINAGDTVSIAYLDDREEVPIITGIIPRTNGVSTSDPDEVNGYLPHKGYTDNRPTNPAQPQDETSQSNSASQPSERSDRYTSVLGDVLTLTNTCNPNDYKTTAVTSEMNNLFNQISSFADDSTKVESFISSTIDRVHALVNPHVGDMFYNLFEYLVPIINAGLKALYKAVYAKVLAATKNPVVARLAAEAALIALIPPIQALQEAIQLLADEIVSRLLTKVDDLVRDTVGNNTKFTDCTAQQFNASIVNIIIDEIDSGMVPLLAAIAKILSGGVDAGDVLRSTVDMLRNFVGGMLGQNQGGNKCSGMKKEYVFGIGPKTGVGDILDTVLNVANTGKSLVNAAKSGDISGALGAASDLGSAVGGGSGNQLSSVTNSAGQIVDSANQIQAVVDNFQVPQLIQDFGDFPFLSESSNVSSPLSGCNRGEETTCYPPSIRLTGGRGEGALARPIVGEYITSTEDRGISGVQGGVVAVEIVNSGAKYSYPPTVEISDNCSSGIGAVCRAVLDSSGGVKAIYVVNPGEGYIGEGNDIFVVGAVEVVSGGVGYLPGIVTDQFGGQYEVVVTQGPSLDERLSNIVDPTRPQPTPGGGVGDGTTRPPIGEEIQEQIIGSVLDVLQPGAGGGTITEVIPINTVQVPGIPIINIPSIDPAIPPGGLINDDGVVIDRAGNPVAPSNGLPGDKAIIGRGAKVKPILTKLPPVEDILSGNLSEELLGRFTREELVQVIDCITH